jgi:hypothetical protein
MLMRSSNQKETIPEESMGIHDLSAALPCRKRLSQIKLKRFTIMEF